MMFANLIRGNNFQVSTFRIKRKTQSKIKYKNRKFLLSFEKRIYLLWPNQSAGNARVFTNMKKEFR